MRFMKLIFVFALTSLFSFSQVQIGIQLNRDQFVLYEPIPVQVVVQNNSSGPLELKTSWLSFIITRPDGFGVKGEQKIETEPKLLQFNEKKTFTVNITPLYSIREVGQYLVQAVVEVNDQQFVSRTLSCNVANGLRIWSESRPVNDVQRNFQLLRFSPDGTKTLLFVRVEEPSENKVYSTFSLGEVVTYIQPETHFDTEGNLHVLHAQGQGAFRYSRISSGGKLENQSDYRSSNQSRPTLVKSEGIVMVQGGLTTKDQPKRARLSAGQKSVTAEQKEAALQKEKKK